MKEITYCGLQVKEHPTLGVWVREDGAVLAVKCGSHGPNKTYDWTFGCKNKRDGYMTVRVCDKTREVHRLVIEAFKGLAPGKDYTPDHINRIRDDNRISNLRYANRSEQQANQDRVDKSVAKYGVRASYDIKTYRANYKKVNRERINQLNREYARRRKMRSL